MATAPTRAAAAAMDVADELAGYGCRFEPLPPGVLYMDGSSLGRLPLATPARLAQVVREEWGGRLVEAWPVWMDRAVEVGDALGAAALGAGPGQVVVADSTSVNLYKLVVAAADARPGRPVLVGVEGDFPTDRYVLEGVAQARGMTLRWVSADPVEGPTVPDVAAALNSRVAVVALSHGHYRSAALADVAGIEEACRRAGALVCWDLSHSVGVVPLALDAWGVHLAVGCTYKYLCAGPGAPAFLYVRRSLQGELRQPVWGWFGQRDQFAMGSSYDPVADVRRFQVGTPPILGLVGVEVGVSLLASAGIEAVRAKSEALTSLALACHQDWLAPLGGRLATPLAAVRRGGHVAIGHDHGYAVGGALRAHGVVGDFRPPDVLRLGMAPLATRFVDVWDALDRLREVLEAGEWRRFEGEAPGRVP